MKNEMKSRKIGIGEKVNRVTGSYSCHVMIGGRAAARSLDASFSKFLCVEEYGVRSSGTSFIDRCRSSNSPSIPCCVRQLIATTPYKAALKKDVRKVEKKEKTSATGRTLTYSQRKSVVVLFVDPA